MRWRITGSYVRPPGVETWLLDIHALNILRSALSTTRQSLAYEIASSSACLDDPQGLFEAVDFKFKQALCEFAHAAHGAVAKVGYLELVQACDPHLVPPSLLRSWLIYESSVDIRRGFHVLPNGGFELVPFKSEQGSFMGRVGGWPSVIRIFQAAFWKEADAYGGERWAHIAASTMNLLGKLKRGSPESVMGAVRDLISLRHNTGWLFAKPSMGQMAISNEILDQIAKYPQIRDIQLYLSDPVRELVQRAMPYVDERAVICTSKEIYLDGDKTIR